MDLNLKSMLDQIGVLAQDQQTLMNVHSITNFGKLKENQSQFESAGLKQIKQITQTKIAMTLAYLDSLREGSKDPLPRFSKGDWVDFCTTYFSGEDSGLEPDSNGDDDADHHNSVARRAVMVEPPTDKNSKFKSRSVRVPSELGLFEMLDQSFDPSDELDELEPKQMVERKEKTDFAKADYMDYKDKRYFKGHCYNFINDKGDDIFVGIKSFASQGEAYCVRVLHAKYTFLGTGVHSDDFQDAVKKYYPTMHVQVKGIELLELSDLGPECVDPQLETIPELVYDPLTTTSSSFGYAKEQTASMKRANILREEIRMIEGFSGAGGMHLGYKEEGFKTVCAVEMNPIAVKTFKLNNPEVDVYEGDIRKFIEKFQKKASGRIDFIHTSSPCQGFSKANRTGGKNDERNNELSYTFVDLLRVTGALVGVFENVDGMWMRKNIHYLHKILVSCIDLGYQVKVQRLKAKDYGDPQPRPRLIIFAAKNNVIMPESPRPTHGPNAHNPLKTTKDALDFLCGPIARARKYPNMEPVPSKTSYDPNNIDHTKLDPNKLAPAVLASGFSVFHYAEDRLLNVREIASLQSFPLDYEFCGTRAEQIKQAGNAVPVEFARALAKSVRESVRLYYEHELVAAMEQAKDNEGEHEEALVQTEATSKPTTVNVNADKNEMTETAPSETPEEKYNQEKDISVLTADRTEVRPPPYDEKNGSRENGTLAEDEIDERGTSRTNNMETFGHDEEEKKDEIMNDVATTANDAVAVVAVPAREYKKDDGPPTTSNNDVEMKNNNEDDMEVN